MSAPGHSIVNHSNPAQYAAVVTPSDTESFTQTARALYIGGAGNVNVVLPDGSDVLFVGLAAGSILPVRCTRVNDADTTASDIVALY